MCKMCYDSECTLNKLKLIMIFKQEEMGGEVWFNLKALHLKNEWISHSQLWVQ